MSEHANPNPPTASAASSKRRKALLLEDDVAFRAVLRHILTKNSFEVTSVTNGIEGIDAILSCEFDLVICDMQLDTLPADQFYSTITEVSARMSNRFIFMTGRANDPTAQKLAALVGGMILTKPFQDDDLLELAAFVELRALA